MEYKGYRAKTEFSEEDEAFIGHVLGINDIICFHGSSVRQLKKAFKECVDNYLDHCKKVGKEPDKEFSGRFNLRIPSELHRKLYLNAEKSGESLNSYLKKILNSVELLYSE